MRIVIDTDDWKHALRRWWWKRKRGRPTDTQCSGCGVELTRDEAFHYICNCERCEGIDFHRWQE